MSGLEKKGHRHADMGKRLTTFAYKHLSTYFEMLWSALKYLSFVLVLVLKHFMKKVLISPFKITKAASPLCKKTLPSIKLFKALRTKMC